MFNWIRKRLGYHACEEFTMWETIQARFSRPVDYKDGPVCLSQDHIEFTRRWQERTCKACGKMQQRELSR